jgi:hypothetical protein
MQTQTDVYGREVKTYYLACLIRDTRDENTAGNLTSTHEKVETLRVRPFVGGRVERLVSIREANHPQNWKM